MKKIQIFLFNLLLSTLMITSPTSFAKKQCVIKNDIKTSGQYCLSSQGIKRHYNVFVADNITANPGLIIVLHGGGDSAKNIEKYSHFNTTISQSGHFYVVYPQAINKQWGEGRQHLSKSDDVQFVKAIIQHFSAQKRPLNQDKIAIIGMSNGGVMTQRLACELKNSNITYGVVSALMSKEVEAICKNTLSGARKIVYFFGDQDTAFLKNGSIVSPIASKKIRGNHIGINKTLDFWVRNNTCRTNFKTRRLPDRYNKKWGKWKDDQTTVNRIHWEKCNKDLLWYDIQGGGHGWPEPKAKNSFFRTKLLNLGYNSNEISVAEEFINFIDD